jgi:hypothetical protein
MATRRGLASGEFPVLPSTSETYEEPSNETESSVA